MNAHQPGSPRPADDVIVLGGGIIGVCVALHLSARNRRVTLLDRRDPGEEASFGNAGLIESSAILPLAFPRDPASLFRYALNRSTELRWDWRALPACAPWLFRFWQESAPAHVEKAAEDMLPLMQRCLAEHEILAKKAGIGGLIENRGFLEVFRDGAAFARHADSARRNAERFALHLAVLDDVALQRLEPSLAQTFCGALHWHDPKSVSDPGALVKGYARSLEERGGSIVKAEATGLFPEEDGWAVGTRAGPLRAKEVVIALGAWSDRLFRPLGYRLPLLAKRGYHMHYAPSRAIPGRPVLDAEQGYVIAPVAGNRLRLTTGVEIAARDASPNEIQLGRAEAAARPLFGLGARLDPAPWLGLRPCMPDMRPVIGPAPRHHGLWFAFGHNHFGLTLGAVTGRLLAEMMTGESPCVSPKPYLPARFG